MMKKITFCLLTAAALAVSAQDGDFPDGGYYSFNEEFYIATQKDEDKEIYCGANADLVYCEIALDSSAADDDGCDLDRFTVFTLPLKGKADAEAVCAGDTLFTGTNVVQLKEGESISGEGWFCGNRMNALTCHNEEGHGFVIRQEGHELITQP